MTARVSAEIGQNVQVRTSSSVKSPALACARIMIPRARALTSAPLIAGIQTPVRVAVALVRDVNFDLFRQLKAIFSLFGTLEFF